MSYIQNSRTNSSQSLFFLHLFILSKHSSIAHVPCSLLRFVYQSIDKIDMCIRTVLELSGYKVHDYVELCRLYKNALSSNFVYYYRPYISDLFSRTFLRVPSDVGRDVISNLPNQYKSLLRRFSYSTAKLNRYKKFLLRNGIIKIPTFSFLDGFFSCYTNAPWNKRAFSNTFSLIKLTTRRSVSHDLPLYQSASTYVRLFYLFLYSYVFVRNNRTDLVAYTLLSLSRISLFSVFSLHFYNSSTSTVGTSTVFFNSFLSRTASLFHIHRRSKASSSNMKLDYLNIRPFFHGDSIVFFKYLSQNRNILEFRCRAASTNYSAYFSAFLFCNVDTERINVSWNCLKTRQVVRSTLFASKLRSHFIRARLVSQSCVTPRIISDKIYTLRYNKRFITLKKKARKYFSMSRRHYQHK